MDCGARRNGTCQRGRGEGIRKTGGKSEESGRGPQEEKMRQGGRAECREPQGRKRTRWGCPNNGGWLDALFKQGGPPSSWPSMLSTGPSNDARERKACGVQPVTLSHRPLSSMLIGFSLNFIPRFLLQKTYRHSPAHLQPESKPGGQARTKRRPGAPWTANIGHRTASGTMAPGIPRHPLSSLRFPAQTLPTPISASWAPPSPVAHQHSHRPKRKAFRSCEFPV